LKYQIQQQDKDLKDLQDKYEALKDEKRLLEE